MRDPHDDALAIGRLKRRADFLRAAKGKRWHGKAFSLQAITRSDGETHRDGKTLGGETHARVGFTLTRKVGGAVIRNRARRRLKEALRLGALPLEAGHDYVVVGRIEAIRQPFEALKKELARAVAAVHAGKATRRDAARRPETASKTDRPHTTRP